MTKPFQYKILGTSHVADQSVREIREAMDSFKPDLVCVELDKSRLYGLLNNKKSKFTPNLIFKVGLGGYLFGLMGSFIQKKIGGKLGISPGQDMLTAVKLAGERKLPLALIDQDISITLKRISKNFRWKERLQLVKDIFMGFLMPKRTMRRLQADVGDINFDLRTVPDDKLIKKMMGNLKKQYPGLYKALVEDRNNFMSNKVIKIFKKEPLKRLLIVVGAGHQEEMQEIIDRKILKLEYLGD